MTQPLPTPEACALTMSAVLVDPLDSGPDAEAHMQICRACSEARIAYLAQEDAPQVLVPTGYFERLPGRILGKLPAPVRLSSHTKKYIWGLAASLLFAVSATTYWVGRANRMPLVEASLPRTSAEIQEFLPDSPFQDREDAVNDDAVTQLTALSEDDANAVIRTLAKRPTPPPVEK
jgi:hypothetical protein